MSDSSSSKRHDSLTGVLLHEPEQPPHSASGFDRYHNSPAHKDHPYGYIPCIHAVTGGLGSGKSTIIYGIVNEIRSILDKKKLGRILFYSGSRSDKILEAYDDRVEKFSPSSKETFLGEIRGMLNEASDRAERIERKTAKKEAADSKKETVRTTRGKTLVVTAHGVKGSADESSSSESECDSDCSCSDCESDDNDDNDDEDETPKMNIVILEDAAADKDIMPTNLKTDSPLLQMAISCRHIPTALIVSSQKINMLPTFIRANASHLYFAGPRGDGEKRDAMKLINFSKAEFDSALSSITERSQFLWINQGERRISKGFCSSICR